MSKPLDKLAWDLLRVWYDGGHEMVVSAIKHKSPLEAAYIAAYLTEYLTEDDDDDGSTMLAFYDALEAK